MSMFKEIATQQRGMHLFVDIYGILPDRADDAKLMSDFMRAVHQLFPGRKGILSANKVYDSSRPKNNGVSGALVVPAAHVTFHTFSQRGVAFLDAFVDDSTTMTKILELVQKHFQYQSHVICRDHLGEGFGTHVVITTDRGIEIHRANKAITEIISAIGMTPLGSRLSEHRSSNFDLLQMITESHIAIHRNSKGMTIDVFSCRPFDIQTVFAILETYHIKVSKNNHFVVSRGTNLSDKTF